MGHGVSTGHLLRLYKRDRGRRIIGPCEKGSPPYWKTMDDVTQQLLRSSFCGLSLDLLLILGSVISDGQLTLPVESSP